MWNGIEESSLFPLRYERSLPLRHQNGEEPEEEELEIDDVLQKRLRRSRSGVV